MTTGDGEVLRRADALREQIAMWSHAGRIGVPVLTLPDAPEPRAGGCLACGAAIAEARWRCALCLRAVELALRVPPVADEDSQRARP